MIPKLVRHLQALLNRLSLPNNALHLLALAAAITPGLLLRNPAVGLIGGAACVLLLGSNPISQSSHYAKLALQSAIVLLGFSMNLGAVVELSSTYAGVVTGYVLATFGIGLLLSKLFKIDPITGGLLTIGTAICGGTAIAAAAPLLKADPGRIGVALGAVFLLNLVALLTFPHLGSWLNMSQIDFGAFAALAVHDTSSVVATAAIYGQDSAEVATTVKLGRTLWLVPLVIFLGIWRNGERGGDALRRASIPLFVVLFIVAAGVATWVPLPGLAISSAATISKMLLVVALFLVGLELNRTTLARLKGRDGIFALVIWLIMAPLAMLGVMAVSST